MNTNSVASPDSKVLRNLVGVRHGGPGHWARVAIYRFSHVHNVEHCDRHLHDKTDGCRSNPNSDFGPLSGDGNLGVRQPLVLSCRWRSQCSSLFDHGDSGVEDKGLNGGVCVKTGLDPPWWTEWIVDDFGSERREYERGSERPVLTSIQDSSTAESEIHTGRALISEAVCSSSIYRSFPLAIVEPRLQNDLQPLYPAWFINSENEGFSFDCSIPPLQKTSLPDLNGSSVPDPANNSPDASSPSSLRASSLTSTQPSLSSCEAQASVEMMHVQGSGKVGIPVAKSSLMCLHCHQYFSNELQYR